MNKIIVAIFAATLSTTAFASESLHNGQSVRDVAVQVQSDTGFGLSQGTLLNADTTRTVSIVGADSGANSGK